MVYPGIESPDISVSFEEKENIIVTVSRLFPEKNLERLRRILNKVEYKHYLIGFASNYTYVDKLSKMLPRTTLIINASQEEKLSILKNAKVFLMTSEGESFPLVLIESLALGVAPVAPRSGGPAEFSEEFFYMMLMKKLKKKY